MTRREWTRDELIVAFNLYCKIPFGKIHIHNPLVKELAKAIGRTPSAVSWKLANFASLDPLLQARNIAGAKHSSNADKEIWNEFNADWEKLAFESEHLRSQLTGHINEIAVAARAFPEGKNRETLIRVRVNQGFFRAAVLAAYGERCCITGLSIPQLLTASHIVPWSVDAGNRTNPRNGLCLNAIHDRAFDCGLLTVTPDLRIKLSPRIKRAAKENTAREMFGQYDGASISLPQRFAPSEEFLFYHNRNIFLAV
jgi:putative restriction endonuclease